MSLFVKLVDTELVRQIKFGLGMLFIKLRIYQILWQKNGRKVIGIYSDHIDEYLINPLVEEYPNLFIRSWFTKFKHRGKTYYECNIKDGPGLKWLKNNCK